MLLAACCIHAPFCEDSVNMNMMLTGCLGLNQELKLKYNAPSVLTTSIHPNWVRTPLIQPFEKELDAAGAPIIEPQTVADAVVKQVAGARGGQVYLPASVGLVSILRGLPNWVQEGFRATTSRAVLGSVK